MPNLPSWNNCRVRCFINTVGPSFSPWIHVHGLCIFIRARAHTCVYTYTNTRSRIVIFIGTTLFINCPNRQMWSESDRCCSVFATHVLYSQQRALCKHTRARTSTRARTHTTGSASCNRLVVESPKPRQQQSCSVDMAGKYRNVFLNKDGNLPNLLEWVSTSGINYRMKRRSI